MNSLKKRPMRRVIAPLMKMGVHFEPEAQENLPITEIGNPNLRPSLTMRLWHLLS